MTAHDTERSMMHPVRGSAGNGGKPGRSWRARRLGMSLAFAVSTILVGPWPAQVQPSQSLVESGKGGPPDTIAGPLSTSTIFAASEFRGANDAFAAPRKDSTISRLPQEEIGLVAGVVFAKASEVEHFLGFGGQSPSRTVLQMQAQAEERPVGRELSPSAGKPYLEVVTGNATAKAIGPGRTIQLAGRNYRAGSIVEINVDGKPVEKITVGQDGKFSAAVAAPPQLGIHKITIVDQASTQVIDGAMLIVRPEDKD